MTRRIILEENKQPALEGEWTIGAVLAAAEFLRRWIEGQQIATQPAPITYDEMMQSVHKEITEAPPEPAAKGK